jgi:hypothetical protein
MGDLRRIMLEAKRGRMDTYLRVLEEEAPPMEAGTDSQAHSQGESGDSLDEQVDRYLHQYESDSKKTDNSLTSPGTTSQMESMDWRDLVKGVLIEAGQGDKDSQGGADDAAPGAEGMTGDDDDEGKLGMDDLDVAKFCDDVVRLIENYDSLLEVKATLMRRARGFLNKNYKGEVLEAFDNVMRDDHGLVPGMDKQSVDDERFPAPPAARASGSAEAGPGGGGAGGAV